MPISTRAAGAAAAVLLAASNLASAQSLKNLAPECKAPPAPAIPAASTATEEQLINAQGELKAFLAAGDAYLNCLKEAEAALGDTVTPEQQQLLLNAYNGMVDTMQHSGALFNEAVRAFKQRSQ